MKRKQKPKRETPFYMAAKQIARAAYEKVHNDGDEIGCCEHLHNTWTFGKSCGTPRHKEFFEKHFRPTMTDVLEYKGEFMLWMSSRNRSNKQNRQDRVIALLFADQMWRDGIR